MAVLLPGGRTGQALASGVTLLVPVLIWFSLMSPVLDWYSERDDRLRAQSTLAHRMATLVETLPALRREAESDNTAAASGGILLPGATDAIAAAVLQQKIDELAAAAGIRLASEEIMPARAAADIRAIPVRVTLNAPWRKFVVFLLSLAQAELPMMAEEVLVRGTPRNMLRGPDALPDMRVEDSPVDVSMVVTSFRPAKGDAR